MKPASLLCSMFALALLLFATACSTQVSEPPPNPQPQQAPPQRQAAPAPQRQAAPAAQPAAQPAAPAAQPVAPAAQPATQPAPPAPASGKATEQYRLQITNWAKVPITVSLNGNWVGQWDSNSDVPLDNVNVGKNDLTIDVQGEPKNDLTVAVVTKRSGQNVSLLSFNFKDKPSGARTYSFVGR